MTTAASVCYNSTVLGSAGIAVGFTLPDKSAASLTLKCMATPSNGLGLMVSGLVIALLSFFAY